MLGSLLNKQSKVDESKTKDTNLNVGKMEVLDMEEKDVMAMVDKSVKKMKDEIVKELKPSSKTDKTNLSDKLTDDEIKTLKSDAEKGNLESYKKLVEKGVDVKGLAIDVEKMESFKTYKENTDKSINALNEKLGIDPSKKSIDGQDKDKKNEPAVKTDADFYKEAGLKFTGRPLPKK